MRTIGRRRSGKSRAGRVLLLLLVGAAVAVVLPTSITGRFSNLLQVLVPFQDGVTRLFQSGDDAIQRDAPDLTHEIYALQSTVETLAAQNLRLKRDIEVLQDVRGRGLGSEGRLIPARVVAGDAAHWRQSRLILSGTRQGIATNQGVLSRHFTIETSDSEAATGMAVLAAEVLIGVIEHAGTHTSRVKLLSDPDTLMPVTIGRVAGGRYSPVDKSFLLVGAGRGGIEIREVHHRYVDDGSIQFGDVVLTRDDEPQLPPSVSIGVIRKIKPDPDNGLLYTLEVESRIDLTDVRRVYVANLTR